MKKRTDVDSCIGDWTARRHTIRYFLDRKSGSGGEPWQCGGCTVRFCEQADDVFPELRFAHKVNTYLRHTGWYVDNLHDETTVGVVVTLPGRRGFAAATTDPWNFGIESMTGPLIVEIGETYAEESDAARAADLLARKTACYTRIAKLQENYWEAVR